MTTQAQAQEPDFTCPRCAGRGGLNCFTHIHGGICFECWGTKQSFKLERAHLVAKLEGLRKAWRRASPTARPRIEAEGKRAASAVVKFDAFRAGHIEQCRLTYK
jgi:hypothetical protein